MSSDLASERRHDGKRRCARSAPDLVFPEAHVFLTPEAGSAGSTDHSLANGKLEVAKVMTFRNIVRSCFSISVLLFLAAAAFGAQPDLSRHRLIVLADMGNEPDEEPGGPYAKA
jgi:hypothetical protein